MHSDLFSCCKNISKETLVLINMFMQQKDVGYSGIDIELEQNSQLIFNKPLCPECML